MTFNDIGLIEPILKALHEQGYQHPTPIQQQAIPPLLKGNDLLGCAQTGTGKTAAFALPIIQLLQEHKKQQVKFTKQISALILTPTRELAIQIDESFEVYGSHTNITHAVIFGGVSQHAQTQTLRNGVDVLIATPGRLLDLMQQGYVDLRHIKWFVLDEADRMLDMGFVHDVKKVLAKLPKQKQSLFFSATMPPEIVKLADMILHHPVKVEVTPVSSTAETVTQYLYYVDKANKKHLLIELLKQKEIKNVLVFARTKHGADRLAKDLVKQGFKAAAIHGDKSQNARQHALNDFKEGKIRTLVATDIAARGIDIDSLSHVLNYEIPNQPETYVHRIGRTGRGGATGISISFCDAEEMEYIRDIQKLTGVKLTVVEQHPFPLKEWSPVQKNPNDRRHQKRATANQNKNAKPAGGNSSKSNWFKPKSRSKQGPARGKQ